MTLHARRSAPGYFYSITDTASAAFLSQFCPISADARAILAQSARLPNAGGSQLRVGDGCPSPTAAFVRLPGLRAAGNIRVAALVLVPAHPPALHSPQGSVHAGPAIADPPGRISLLPNLRHTLLLRPPQPTTVAAPSLHVLQLLLHIPLLLFS